MVYGTGKVAQMFLSFFTKIYRLTKVMGLQVVSVQHSLQLYESEFCNQFLYQDLLAFFSIIGFPLLDYFVVYSSAHMWFMSSSLRFPLLLTPSLPNVASVISSKSYVINVSLLFIKHKKLDWFSSPEVSSAFCMINGEILFNYAKVRKWFQTID